MMKEFAFSRFIFAIAVVACFSVNVAYGITYISNMQEFAEFANLLAEGALPPEEYMLSNDLDLKFNYQGQLLGMDD